MTAFWKWRKFWIMAFWVTVSICLFAPGLRFNYAGGGLAMGLSWYIFLTAIKYFREAWKAEREPETKTDTY